MPKTETHFFQETDGSCPAEEWLELLEQTNERAFHKCITLIHMLSEQGNELRYPIAKRLSGTDGIFELRGKVGTVNYRILYFFNGANIVVVSHGLTKEKDVPQRDIELAERRKNLVKSNGRAYTKIWKV